MAVSKRIRFEVLRRDNYTCRYCRSTDNPLTVDHVTPVSLGGTDTPDNLVAACQDCNGGKSSAVPDATLVADVAEDAVRWTRAMRAASSILSQQMKQRYEYAEIAKEAWDGFDNPYWPAERPDDWQLTFWRFHDLGLPGTELVDAIYRAHVNQRIDRSQIWRYMCGIAWKKLTDIQTLAREQLEWTGEA